MNRILILFVFLSIIACKPKQELILIETDYGNMKISLYDTTPIHRDNFKKLAKEGYYDGSLFHRVINGFMIQGGDPNSIGAGPNVRLGSGGPGYTLEAEIGEKHYKGVIAAARTGGPSNPDKRSSGSQFYIVHGKPTQSAQLNAMSRGKNFTYTQEEITKYESVGGAPFLDGDYTVFGEVVEGMEVIDKIAAVQTAPGDRPLQDVKMKVSVIK